MTYLIALVGLCGSGKSEAAKILLEKGFSHIRFGQLTMDELKKRDLPTNEKNERAVREELRRVHGKAAYATLNIPRLEELSGKGSVVIDGLYSWEEFCVLKDAFAEQLIVVALYTKPSIRYERLSKRPQRPLTKTEAIARDIAEIENIGKAGPIAIADSTIINNGSLDELRQKIEGFCGEFL